MVDVGIAAARRQRCRRVASPIHRRIVDGEDADPPSVERSTASVMAFFLIGVVVLACLAAESAAAANSSALRRAKWPATINERAVPGGNGKAARTDSDRGLRWRLVPWRRRCAVPRRILRRVLLDSASARPAATRHSEQSSLAMRISFPMRRTDASTAGLAIIAMQKNSGRHKRNDHKTRCCARGFAWRLRRVRAQTTCPPSPSPSW